jgi:hypothetical protein
MRPADERIARRKFTAHKYDAKQRGVGFELTFQEWWSIWRASGHWEERGVGNGKYCMARYGDTGPYAVGNVRIITNELSRNAARCRACTTPLRRRRRRHPSWTWRSLKNVIRST